jgi:hypothetical protein
MSGSSRQQVWCELRRIWGREPWWAEFWPACGALGWAVLAYTTQANMTDRPALAVLGLMLDDDAWAVLVGAIGLGQLVALFSYCRRARWLSCVAASGFWWLCVVAICLPSVVSPDPAGTPLSLALYLMAALPCSYSVLRLRWTIK